MHQVAIIDYGMGNLRSVAKALETVAPKSDIKVTANSEEILAADHIVFPGQGAIAACMNELNRLELTEVIRTVSATKPFLGICIGMQLLLSRSDENQGVNGFDLFTGHVSQFNFTSTENKNHLKVPHMGWNQVHQTIEHPLWKNIKQDSRFYFVHSYFVNSQNKATIAATTNYPDSFTSAIAKDNIFAVQFHPEKSHHAGLKLLDNFINWDGQSSR